MIYSKGHKKTRFVPLAFPMDANGTDTHVITFIEGARPKHFTRSCREDVLSHDVTKHISQAAWIISASKKWDTHPLEIKVAALSVSGAMCILICVRIADTH